MENPDWLSGPIRKTAVFGARCRSRTRRSAPWNEAGDFDADRWLRERFGLTLPRAPGDFPLERWKDRTSDPAPEGGVADVVGQALDIWTTAKRIRAIAAPAQVGAQGDDLAAAAEASGGAVLPDIMATALKGFATASVLLDAVGLGRLVEVVLLTSYRLESSIQLWSRSGLLGSGPGQPEDIAKRAFVEWLRLAAAQDVEIAALMLHLGVDSGLTADRTRSEALRDFVGRRVTHCAPLDPVDPLLNPLRVLAWLAASEVEAARVGADLHALTGMIDAHPVFAVGSPPGIVEPGPGNPWFWVPVPAWALPRGEAIRVEVQRTAPEAMPPGEAPGTAIQRIAAEGIAAGAIERKPKAMRAWAERARTLLRPGVGHQGEADSSPEVEELMADLLKLLDSV